MTFCKRCSKEIYESRVGLNHIWFHSATGLMHCEVYAEPEPPKPTRQERANRPYSSTE